MGETTNIAWTEKTWNPWMGCDKVSPECAHCYMFRDMRKYGKNPDVVVRSKTMFDAPLKWQREQDAKRARGETVTPVLCFTCSWSDWFHHDADAWRPEAWAIVKRCPDVFFQILTKGTHPEERGKANPDWQKISVEDITRRLPDDWGDGYPNVGLGVSIGTDAMTHRADTLRQIPARVRFISAEPLLSDLPSLDLTGIHWLIVGGESGSGFRPMLIQWAINLQWKAYHADVAFFFKQDADTKPGQRPDRLGRLYQEFPDAMKRAAA